MQAHKESGQSVGADALVGLAGFAPPTLHALGARGRRSFPAGVQRRGHERPRARSARSTPVARRCRAYPVVPLARGQALTIGVTSYDGGLYYGLWADRDAMPDLAVLGQCIEDALAELLETV